MRSKGMNSHSILLCVLCLFLPVLLNSQTVQHSQQTASARLFVQRFYDWYAPLANRVNKEPSSDIAIRIKPALFDNKLLTALKEDSAAQDKEPGSIVGLDFDPFLNTQDPCDRYRVGKIDKRGDSYFVEIYGSRNGIKSEVPNVIAEIARKNNTWIFVNFHYSYSSGDLLSVLSALKQQRN